MDKKKKLKVIMPIILVIAVAGGFVYKSIKDKQNDTYVYFGTVEADTMNLSSEIGGKIKEVKLKEGAKVKPGDLVAIIDSNESSLKLQDSEITIKNAENELGKIEDGARAEEIKGQEAVVRQAQSVYKQGEEAVAIAENNLNSAQSNYDFKKKIYDDAVTLYNNGSEAKYKVDATKNDLDNATNTLNNAKSSVENSMAQLSNYSAQLDSAKEKLQLLLNKFTEKDKNTAEYSLEKAQKGYELNKLALDKSSILSSADGVIETVNFKVGEYVTPGSAVATMLDNKNLWVKIYIPENMLTNVKLDKEVTLQSDFLKDKTLKGKIIFISPEAEFTPMNIVTKKDRTKLVYEVKVKIIDNTDAVKPGMLLDVNLK